LGQIRHPHIYGQSAEIPPQLSQVVVKSVGRINGPVGMAAQPIMPQGHAVPRKRAPVSLRRHLNQQIAVQVQSGRDVQVYQGERLGKWAKGAGSHHKRQWTKGIDHPPTPLDSPADDARAVLQKRGQIVIGEIGKSYCNFIWRIRDGVVVGLLGV
jgi:hypothetical protein